MANSRVKREKAPAGHPTGIEEPKLNEVTWAAVDKASKVLGSRFK